MPDNPSKPAMPPLLKGVLVFLGVSASAATAYLVTASGDLILPAKLIFPICTAFGALILAWASWSYGIWVRDSKRQRVKDAHGLGRRLCACTESGEILTYHHDIAHSIEVYSCPNCTRYDVRTPNGEVFIAEDMEFIPPLPKKVHDAWLTKSSNQR